MALLRFLKARRVLEILGIILLSAFIWFAGPYFAFADFRPFNPEWMRLTAIVLLVLIRAAIKLTRVVKAWKTSAKAIAALKASRRRGHNLYSEPWYVIIGAPGSGKSTLLQNSGLQFPLAQRFGRDAVRGVGGTRNCDWWFTDDAIFLDTAGRFTAQDSDPGSDARGWKEFLALL